MSICSDAGAHDFVEHHISKDGAQVPQKRICLDCGLEQNYRYYRTLREANEMRQREWDPTNKLPLSFRFCELAGEVGEACNVLKKIEREQLGILGSRATTFQLMEELADVAICVDIVLMYSSIDPFSNLELVKRDEGDVTLTEIGSRMAYRAGRACDLWRQQELREHLWGLYLLLQMAALRFNGNLATAIERKFNATSAKVGLLTRIGEPL